MREGPGLTGPHPGNDQLSHEGTAKNATRAAVSLDVHRDYQSRVGVGGCAGAGAAIDSIKRHTGNFAVGLVGGCYWNHPLGEERRGGITTREGVASTLRVKSEQPWGRRDYMRQPARPSSRPVEDGGFPPDLRASSANTLCPTAETGHGQGRTDRYRHGPDITGILSKEYPHAEIFNCLLPSIQRASCACRLPHPHRCKSHRLHGLEA